MNKIRKQLRLKGFDYSNNGFYFITICIEKMNCILGNVINRKMELNWSGKIADRVLRSLESRFPVLLDTYQIMPNHIHFVLKIQQTVGAHHDAPGLVHHDEPEPDRRPLLAQIIGYFKMNTTKIIRAHRDAPLHLINHKIWQRNYYEHIIRNNREYFAIKQYILDNPKNWKEDEYHQ